MDPATISIIAGLLLKYGPSIAAAVAGLFAKNTHTLEEWNAIFDQVQTYDAMDSASKLRVGTISPISPGQ